LVSAMMEEPVDAEYLVNLQLPASSPWLKELLARRACVEQELLADETGLYPPHVSVTGFFSANPKQAAAVCSTVRELINAAPCGFEVELRKILSTESGYVLVDVVAPKLAELASTLAAKAIEQGVQIRPKAVRHLSLASGRTPEEQQRIHRLYEGLPLGECSIGHPLELVVTKLRSRSNLQRFRQEKKAHVFSDLLRIPVALPKGFRGSGAASAFRMPRLLQATVFDASTPMRKRPLELTIDKPDADREITPAKHLKLEPVETPPWKASKELPIIKFKRDIKTT